MRLIEVWAFYDEQSLAEGYPSSPFWVLERRCTPQVIDAGQMRNFAIHSSHVTLLEISIASLTNGCIRYRRNVAMILVMPALAAKYLSICTRKVKSSLVPSLNSCPSMLAPLNCVQVHAFLHQLPERTQLSQKCHPVRHRLEHVVDLAFRCETSDAESDATVCALIAVPKRSQDVARLKRGRCTCAA